MRLDALTFLAAAFLTHHAHADPAMSRLERACCFAFGGVGFASVLSDSETDYRIVLSRKSAASDFETLFQMGNAQAKCYALTGLRQANPRRFESLAAPLKSSRVCVSVTRGCVTSSHSMAEVLQKIQTGTYSRPLTGDLIPPPESPEPSPPGQKQTSLQRLLALFSIASSKPVPPPPPLAPPSPPPRIRRHAVCKN